MGKIDVLVEVTQQKDEAFAMFSMALDSEIESLRQGEDAVSNLAGLGLDVRADLPPVPMFGPAAISGPATFATFSTPETNPDRAATSVVVPCEVERSRLDELRGKPGVRVYPNSPLSLFCGCGQEHTAPLHPGMTLSSSPASDGEPATHLFDLATSAAGIDCRPYRPAVSLRDIRTLLGVERVWFDGFRGQNMVVGIIDDGVNGDFYPVIGGLTRPNLPRPGSADIGSHGSMCAADILLAAPAAKLYDYPFIGQPRSGGALAMFQEVLDQRRRDGTPHLTNNSYGFMARPNAQDFPDHEVWDIDHPLHRKVREVVASGCPTFFAAGNCGAECPDSRCHPSGIGPQKSIHGSNSLEEVITVAAVNSRHDRIGYSSQGPGNFHAEKPDFACYSHFFGNYGPGRPAGTSRAPFDSGTSAATPVAVGVGALLMSAFPTLDPARLKKALIAGAINLGTPGWDRDTGHGVINAAATYLLLREGRV